MKKVNKMIVNILLIGSFIIYFSFLFLTFTKYQVTDFLNINFLTGNDVITSAINFLNDTQDVIILLGVIPQLIIITVLLIILKLFYKNQKNRSDLQFVQIIVCLIYDYFIYQSIFHYNFFTKIISKIYYYNLINIWLYILLIFGIYFTIYSLINIVKTVRKHSILNIMKNYRVFFYPFLIILFIIVIINIFNAFLVLYISNIFLNILSLESLIDLATLFNISVDVSIMQLLPNFISQLLSRFNIDVNMSLSDLGITIDVLNKFLDTFVLRRIDEVINQFILGKITDSVFVNINEFIITLIITGVLLGLEYYNKQKYLINCLGLGVMWMVLRNIDNLTFFVVRWCLLLFIILFIYLALMKNQDVLNKAIYKIKTKILTFINLG